MAEAHPVGFRWAMKARETRRHAHPRRPALLAHERDGGHARADPRRLGHRLPRRADPPHPARPSRYFKEYVLAYTNASTLINEEFEDTEDLGGFFSGFDAEKGVYDPQTWMYEGGEVAAAAGAPRALDAVLRGQDRRRA